MMSSNPRTLFWVDNKHGESSGEPPVIDGSQRGKYYSYFENEYGEQAVFVYDYETETGTLYMGDLGWEEPVTITEDTRSEVILNEAEGLWLGACWMAATSRNG